MVIDETRWVIGIDHAKPSSDRTAYGHGLSFALFEFHIKQVIVDEIYEVIMKKPQTKAEKNRARLKQLRGRAGRWG